MKFKEKKVFKEKGILIRQDNRPQSITLTIGVNVLLNYMDCTLVTLYLIEISS